MFTLEDVYRDDNELVDEESSETIAYFDKNYQIHWTVDFTQEEKDRVFELISTKTYDPCYAKLHESSPRQVDEFTDYDIDPKEAWEQYQQEKSDAEQEEFFSQYEAEQEKISEIKEEVASAENKFALTRVSDFGNPSKVTVVEINSIEDLKRISKESGRNIIISWKDHQYGKSIEIYDDYRE